MLIVEDEESLALALQAVFGVYNSVRVAHSILQTKGILSEDLAFDLVLLDKGLPDGAGTVLVPELRKRFPTAAIIILTGDTDFRSVTQCLRQGADDYIVKSPQTLQDLLVRIPVAFAAAKARAEAGAALSQTLCRLPSHPRDVTRVSFASFLMNAERAYLERALALHDDHTTAVARKLGLGRSTLFKRIQELGIARRPWRRSSHAAAKAEV